VVCIRFGHDWDPQCMVMDETLYGVQAKLQNFAVIYLGKPHRAVFSCLPDSLIVRRVAVDITKVPDFNKAKPSSSHMHGVATADVSLDFNSKMYELYDPCTLMFFYR